MNYEQLTKKSEMFARSLASLYDAFNSDTFDIEAINQEIMRAYLAFIADKTRDEGILKAIEYGATREMSLPDSIVYGFKVRGKNIFISSLLSVLTEMEVPSMVLERFPDIKQVEWEQAMLLASLVFTAFEPVTSSE